MMSWRLAVIYGGAMNENEIPPGWPNDGLPAPLAGEDLSVRSVPTSQTTQASQATTPTNPTAQMVPTSQVGQATSPTDSPDSIVPMPIEKETTEVQRIRVTDQEAIVTSVGGHPTSVTVGALHPAEVSIVPGIQATGLHRYFGPVRAVDGVSFTAPNGAVTALIGPNGSGKTTLLLILAGLLEADSGQALIGGFDNKLQNLEARSLVGWMPDVFGTWDALTCLEILTFYARAYGVDKNTSKVRALQLLERLYLGEFANQKARVLSRGQKQRLGLARALVHDPQVLLLDEPASGLDPRSRIELRDTLRGLANEGKTILVSSHVLSELEEVYDHAVFLSAGRTIDVQIDSQPETVQRGWRLESVDPVGLRTFLEGADIPYRQSPAGGDVVVSLTGFDSAVELIKAAVQAGVPLHTIAPLSGRLEETYLSISEDRS
jgi:ABC-type multidrug transport system ATPase subunit